MGGGEGEPPEGPSHAPEDPPGTLPTTWAKVLSTVQGGYDAQGGEEGENYHTHTYYVPGSAEDTF